MYIIILYLLYYIMYDIIYCITNLLCITRLFLFVSKCMYETSIFFFVQYILYVLHQK